MRSDTPDRVLSPAKFRAAFPNATASARKRNADAHTRWLSDRFAPRFAGAAAAARRAGGGGDCPVVQDAEDRRDAAQPQDRKVVREAADQAGAQEVDGGDRPQFRVTVAFRYHDRRRRDNDGGYSTLLDCVVAARRLLDASAGDGADGGTVQAGTGRRDDNH